MRWFMLVPNVTAGTSAPTATAALATTEGTMGRSTGPNVKRVPTPIGGGTPATSTKPPSHECDTLSRDRRARPGTARQATKANTLSNVTTTTMAPTPSTVQSTSTPRATSTCFIRPIGMIGDAATATTA